MKSLVEKFKPILEKRIFSKMLALLLLVPVILLLILDYLNLESPLFAFNDKFYFELTWKGRLFYLIASWLILVESIFRTEKKGE